MELVRYHSAHTASSKVLSSEIQPLPLLAVVKQFSERAAAALGLFSVVSLCAAQRVGLKHANVSAHQHPERRGGGIKE